MLSFKTEQKLFLFFCVAIFLIFSFQQVFAEMSGGTYKIDSDSVNSGGNDYSVSGDIQIADTVGEIVVGDSSSTNYSITAGYRGMDESSVSIGVTLADIVLSPDLGGLTGGTSTGATQISVLTDNPAGYLLSVEADDSPAMRSDRDTIADYTPISSEPDFQFRLVASTSMFAFTPEGEDIITRYRDDGNGLCNVGNGFDSANRCWDGLASTSKTVSSRQTGTSQLGSTTTIRFSAGIGVGRLQKMGTYMATTTITALAL